MLARDQNYATQFRTQMSNNLSLLSAAYHRRRNYCNFIASASHYHNLRLAVYVLLKRALSSLRRFPPFFLLSLATLAKSRSFPRARGPSSAAPEEARSAAVCCRVFLSFFLCAARAHRDPPLVGSSSNSGKPGASARSKLNKS